MLCKKCPACGKKSYSCVENGQWICPNCQEDLSEEPIASSE